MPIKRGNFFYELGHKTRANLRRGRWVMNSLIGSEEEALQAEYDAGLTLARKIEAVHRRSDDRPGTELLEGVGERLRHELVDKSRRWSVRLLATEDLAAFALPGGFIYVTQPFLELCQADEHELACVIGHEMSHVMRGDAMERIKTQFLASAALRTLRIPGGLLSKWAVNTGMSLLQNAYSRDCELRADKDGTRLAHAASYDPRGAIRVFERLLEKDTSGGVRLAEYFATHPPLTERIARIDELIRGRS